MTDPGFWSRAATGLPPPTTDLGESGYFSHPSETFDPALFDGDHLRSEVRQHILLTLKGWFREQGYTLDPSWLHAWIAGSAISYQWESARGNGDLDVLFSVDVTPFEQANPERWGGVSETELARGLDDDLKQTLWTQEAQVNFGGRVFEVTYFFNPGTGHDISNLRPYAAYCVCDDTWTIRPPKLPADPRTLYPDSWFRQSAQDKAMSDKLVGEFNEHLGRLNGSTAASPMWHNSGAMLNLIVAQASALFSDIHTGRRAAFAPNGKGYGDYANFRWQVSKQSGTVAALHAIVAVGTEAKSAQETAQWGQPIETSTDILLRRASEYKDPRS